MQILERVAIRLSRGLDFLAGFILAVTAALVVANILGRALLQRSILGTYEMVGFFTAAAVGLALARCAIENGHIAVEFIMDRLPERLQGIITIITALPILAFLGFITYHLFLYGGRIAVSGEVSSTTRIIFYPFIYVLALGFFAQTLAELVKLAWFLCGGERR